MGPDTTRGPRKRRVRGRLRYSAPVLHKRCRACGAASGSGSIGRYAVAPGGTLTAIGSTLVENNPASHPLDEGASVGQNRLYVLANGLSQIVGYRVGHDGSLTPVTTAPVAAGSAGVGAG